MGCILIFKTSVDATMKRLFQELGGQDIDCLIQSSQVGRYKAQYPYINFIDICQESFYDLPAEVTDKIVSKTYDKVFVTFSGINGHNYGNVMETVSRVRFKRAFFYNCNGDKIRLPRRNPVRDALCRLYIRWTGFIYILRSERQGVRHSRIH